MKKIANFIVKFRYALILVFVGLLAMGLILMPKVVTNYDLSEYLDADSATIAALEKMEEEFGSNGMAQIMIADIDIETARELKLKIEAVENVAAVTFDEAHNYKENNALFKIFLETGNYDIVTFNTIDEIREELSDYQLAFNGEGVRASYLQKAIKKDLKIILAIIAIVIIAILLLFSQSWAEPIIFIICLAFAVFINLGLNAIFPHISFVTRSICIVLQLALCMDYSIMLLHRFNEEKAKGIGVKEAAANALALTFSPVSASSLTTMGGLAALMFMQYKIGFDIGIVLIKGVHRERKKT